MKSKQYLILVILMFLVMNCKTLSQEPQDIEPENTTPTDILSIEESDVPLLFEDVDVIFETENEQILFNNHVVIEDDFESEKPTLLIVGGCLEVTGELRAPEGGIVLNPSCLLTDTLNINNPNFVLDFGFGGSELASPNGYGANHYSQITVNQLTLNGTLNLSFYYGFQPEIGEEYEIINVLGSRSGEFTNASEGDIVGGVCNVGLRISYQGGSDVILTGVQVDPNEITWPCPNRTLGGNWQEANSWENDVVPNEADQIIISNEIELMISDQVVNTEDVIITNGTLRLVSSCLNINGDLQVPQGGMDLNPSCINADRVSFGNSGVLLNVGIGGPNPATDENRGIGYFSNLDLEQIFMNGTINVSFLYGYQPEPGQIFEIISVSDYGAGNFSNASESDIVGGFCDIGLSISYTGGDGNDVILTAMQVTDPNPIWPCDSHENSVSIEEDGVCRRGPGNVYSITEFLTVGESAIVLGRNAPGNWVFARLSNGSECWIWEGVLSEDSNFGEADVLSDPPTPLVIIAPISTFTPTALPPSAQPPTATSTASPPTVPPPPTLTPTPVDPMNGSISGTVFKDGNGDGNMNNGDVGLTGVTVRLGAGSCGSTGLSSVASNFVGGFSFSGLAAGTYCVSVNISPSCGDYSVATTSTAYTIILAASGSSNVTFGYQKLICN